VPDPEGITVDLLLRMRSGLPDYLGPVFGDPPDLSVLDRYWSPERLVEMALTGRDRVPPDTVSRYCNTDYVLLGMIVEQVTRQRIDAQVWQRILDPLRLTETTFPTVDPHLRGPHAVGYVRATADQPWQDCTTLSPSESFTAGAVVATPPTWPPFSTHCSTVGWWTEPGWQG
jgi:D-alanyl-D-alanine carboxypeptidase